MRHELVTLPDASSVAVRAAELVAAQVRSVVADRGGFTFAVSGGHTPWAMFAELTKEEMPWSAMQIFQVDERVAPDGDQNRNLTHLRDALGDVAAEVVAMPVNEADLEAAADSRSASLTGIATTSAATSLSACRRWVRLRSGSPSGATRSST